MRVILLDNRDSFVYNLVDQLAVLGVTTEVYRNTAPAHAVLAALEPTPQEAAAGQRPALILSPGPGHPRQAGCMMEVLGAALEQGLPTLGICLGFQAIVEAYGGSVGRVEPVHGRSTRVEVTDAGRADAAFAVLDGGPLDVARYHSLGARDLPEELVCLARTSAAVEADDAGTSSTASAAGPAATSGIVMAARHRRRPAVGLQFHPESILTPAGPAILRALIAGLTTTATPTGESR